MIGGVVFFEIWFRYFLNTTLLVDIHILYAQKWAAPFPRSKTKSKMYACARQCEKEICDFVFEHWEGISLGWAQEGLIVVPIVTTYAVPLRRCLLFYTKLFAKNQRLPVPIQTPQFAMIIWWETVRWSVFGVRLPTNLRGYFDEMRRKLNFWLRRCAHLHSEQSNNWSLQAGRKIDRKFKVLCGRG